MTLTIACATGQAFEAQGYDAAINHLTCQRKGGAVQQMPDGFGVAYVKPCDCACHAKQDRKWIPTPQDERYWWRRAVRGPVRLAG